MNDLEIEVSEKDEDPFKDMGFIKFWIVSTLFWMTFPISLAVSYISIKTKQLVKALVHDFLQTIFIILVVISVVIYFIYDYVSGLF